VSATDLIVWDGFRLSYSVNFDSSLASSTVGSEQRQRLCKDVGTPRPAIIKFFFNKIKTNLMKKKQF